MRTGDTGESGLVLKGIAVSSDNYGSYIPYIETGGYHRSLLAVVERK